ncbi:MAG: hypothetical protein WBJ81_05045 [Rickettsiales bacterium]
MDNQLKLAGFLKYCKNLLEFIKGVLTKTISFIKRPKQIYLPRSPANILSKITQEHTWPINKWFLSLILVVCVTAIIIIYYGNRYKFKQLLQAKTNITHSQIDTSIKNFQKSLTIIKSALLRDKRYLEPQKVIQVLKAIYTADERIKLLPLTWYPLSNQHKSCTAQGCTNNKPDEQLIAKFKKNPQELMIYDRFESNGEASIVIILPIAEQVKSSTKSALIGYLVLPVKSSLILHDLYYRLDEKDLIKVSSDKETLYFAKQGEKFWLAQDQDFTKYQFADDLSFSPYTYKIAVGSPAKAWITNSIQIAILYCISIIAFGSIMLIAYNYVERKRVKNSYNENFSGELSIHQEQIKDLTSQVAASNIEIKSLTQQNQNFLDSMRVITNIEQQINQSYAAALLKIRDSNQLLLKHYNKKKELSVELIEKLFTNIDNLSEDLRHNIFNREDKISEVEVSDLFDEILRLFNPIITNRAITIINKIGKTKIKINELLLKQILISLLVKRLYSIPKNHKLNIFTQKNNNKNRITIEINDEGIGINEELIEDILYQKKKNLIPGMIHIQLNLETIEALIKDALGGDINIVSTNHSNNITLLLPLEINRADNVIPLPKIAGGNQ